MFKSKDEKLYEKSKWIFDGSLRFLDNSPIIANKIALSSFPRSGNTMLRKWIEQLTGLTTGADADLLTVLDLQGMGMFGECHKGSDENRCWITKTHYPIKIMKTELPFYANKQFVLVRNPVDAVLSYANLWISCSHSL